MLSWFSTCMVSNTCKVHMCPSQTQEAHCRKHKRQKSANHGIKTWVPCFQMSTKTIKATMSPAILRPPLHWRRFAPHKLGTNWLQVKTTNKLSAGRWLVLSPKSLVPTFVTIILPTLPLHLNHYLCSICFYFLAGCLCRPTKKSNFYHLTHFLFISSMHFNTIKAKFGRVW